MSLPMLASDANIPKIKLPCIVQPKIDGVRGLNLAGTFTGRSLKTHKNRHVTEFYSKPAFVGFDGEMTAEHECHPDLCRITSSALGTIAGTPYTLWHLFDYVGDDAAHRPYQERQDALVRRVNHLKVHNPIEASRLRIVPGYVVYNMEELLAWEDRWLDMGYEGICGRDPLGPYKEGRSTAREGGLWRIKRFVEADALVVAIEEGTTNNNEAQINELGLQYRTSHQDNMLPNGMVGRMLCKVLEDVMDPYKKDKVLLRKGDEIVVSPGKMTVADRMRYWQNHELLVGNPIKFKFFPKGQKDKPRFPTFQSLRIASDIV